MTAVEERSDPELAAPSAVRVRGLVKRYGDLTAVDGIDLDVRAGTCLGILGPNGAGKTTTVEILEGLKQPDAGSVELFGWTWAAEPRAIRTAIGVQLQETNHVDKLTVFETLRMFRSFYEAGEDVGSVLALVELEEKRDARVSDLSGGQKQRLALGCALVNRPRLLFLDEPTTGLDPQARRRVWEVVEEFKQRGGTVVLTTHYMEEAERLADDLVVVDRGRIIASGAPAELVSALDAAAVVELTFAEEAGAVRAREVLSELRVVDLGPVREATLRLTTSDVQAALRGLFDALGEAGLPVLDLHTHRPTLEDVFVHLTGRELREG